MIRAILVLIFCAISLGVYAESKPPGFLWYNLPKESGSKPENKTKNIPFSKLSYTQRDEVLAFWTMEALHKARQTKSVEDMRAFLALKNYWLGESSEFSKLFQKAMLEHPELDYNVTHPTSSLGTKLLDEQRQLKRAYKLKQLSRDHGLLFFYRGNSPYDKKQIPIISELANRYGLYVMPVSVDGQGLDAFDNAVVDRGQADKLAVHFFPAVLLVNPKSGSHRPVAFGLTTADVLQKRLYDVATNFEGEINANN